MEVSSRCYFVIRVHQQQRFAEAGKVCLDLVFDDVNAFDLLCEFGTCALFFGLGLRPLEAHSDARQEC